MFKLNNKWSPLTHLVGSRGPILWYKKTGSRYTFAIAVVGTEPSTTRTIACMPVGTKLREATRAEKRLALARCREPFFGPFKPIKKHALRYLMVMGNIGKALAAQCGEAPLESGVCL
jgi:hypothetical protein